MKTYNVKTNLTHDGEDFHEGDEIALDSKHADPLLAVGAIEDPSAAEKEQPVRAPKKVAKGEKK